MHKLIHSRMTHLALVLGIILALAGCSPLWLLGDTAVSLIAGWLANDWVGGVTQTTCYRNGEPVDCSSLPADIAP